ncbi:MAG: serine/threonine protein kinase [Myxococcales bacterium]|nr:serine/threonine protein kinase [Myxococcales bacterium]
MANQQEHPQDTLSSLPTNLPPPSGEALAPFDPVAAESALAGALGEEGFKRYQDREQIGEGGMGEVRLCLDGRFGREVAMKLVRAPEVTDHGSHADRQMRFLREARVQGRLEHPSIVPVYDLGRDPAGALYFTMKRVRGLTVEEILLQLAAGDPAALQQFSRRKLLSAFTSVCLAVDFAHARGVLHRDLKPSNIMLGDFGEVYVLDWGLAKLAGREEPAPRGEATTVDDPELGAGRTAHGAMMGTPGYMAPEQVRGEVDKLDARTDVYALGAILFELLALQPLHGRNSAAEVIAGTLTGADARASVRAPDRDVPPELEAACIRATRLDPAARHPTARELCQAVERFLDGDRDLGLRREMAASHAQRAEEAATVALSAEPTANDERSRALREVGRALALDQGHIGATRTLVRLLTEPPRELPPAAQAESDRVAMREQRAASRIGFFVYLSWFLYAPAVLCMGVRNWTVVGISAALWGGAALCCLGMYLRPRPVNTTPYPLLILSSLAVASSSLLFGVYILLPSLATVNTMSYMLGRERSHRLLVLVIGCLTILGPLALETFGLIPSAYDFHDGVMTVLPRVLDLPPIPTQASLLIIHLAVVVTSSLIIARIRDVSALAERRLQMQAWQLQQLAPDQAKGAIEPEMPSDPRCFIS